MKPTMRLDFEYRGGPKDGERRSFDLTEQNALDVLDEYSDQFPIRRPVFTVRMLGDNHVMIELRGGVEQPR